MTGHAGVIYEKWVMGQVMGQVMGIYDEQEKSQVMELGEQGHNMWTSQDGMHEVGYLTIVTVLPP